MGVDSKRSAEVLQVIQRTVWFALFLTGTVMSGQTSAIPGDPVTITGKLGVGTATPSQKVEVVTSTTGWDGIQITGNQTSGAGAHLGMASHGGTNRFLDVYVDARPEEDALKFQSNFPAIQFWTLLGTPFSIMTLNSSGDVAVAGDVYSRGVKLVPGQNIPGPKGDRGPAGPAGPAGPRAGCSCSFRCVLSGSGSGQAAGMTDCYNSGASYCIASGQSGSRGGLGSFSCP